MHKRKLSIFLALLLMLGLLWGCEAGPMQQYTSDDKAERVQQDRRDAPMEAEVAMDEAESAADGEFANSQQSDDARKIIYRYDLQMECLDGQKVLDDLNGLVKKYDAYVYDSSINQETPYGLEKEAKIYHLYFVWRVNSKEAEKFVSELKTIAVATSTEISREDQTRGYQDTEARLENKKKEEKRLLELLEEAEEISDVIAIEERLGEIRYEIESLEANLRDVDRDVEESTVSANIHVVMPENIQSVQNKPFLERVRGYFGISLRVLRDGAESLLYALIVFGPWLIMIALISILIIYLIRRSSRKQRLKKREEELAFYQKLQAQGYAPPAQYPAPQEQPSPREQ